MSLDLSALFKKHDDEFLKHKRISPPLTMPHDLAAFTLLHHLVPGKRPIVASAEHDEFFIETDVEKLAEVATEEHIITLIRCGVRYDAEYGCLAMFA